MKNKITAVAGIVAGLAAICAIPLLFKWLTALLFRPGGWQVWLLLGLAVFAIEQVSAWRRVTPARPLPLRDPR